MEAFDPSILEAKREKIAYTKVPVADSLRERQACLHRAGGSLPSLEDLQRHAERYGTELVVETAAELGYGFESLSRLTEICDRLSVTEFRQAHRYGKAPKKSSVEDRVNEILGVENGDDA